MNKPLILVVEDDTPVRNLITMTLKTHEYRYLSAQNGASAVMEALSHNPDIVLLDLGLPDMDGVEIIQKIRSWSNMPIIVISARTEDSDKIGALDAGADDYLTKPFSLKELLARLRSMSRRVDTNFTSNILTVGTVTLNVGEQELVSQNTIRLAGKESKMLEFFMLNAGKKLSTDQIFNHVWANDKDDPEIDNGYVFIYVSYLRQKLKSIGANVVIEGEEMGGYELKEL